MADLGCQDTDRVGGNKKVLGFISMQNGLTLANLSMDKGKCCYLGGISGWFWALRRAPSASNDRLRVSGYRPGRWR